MCGGLYTGKTMVRNSIQMAVVSAVVLVGAGFVLGGAIFLAPFFGLVLMLLLLPLLLLLSLSCLWLGRFGDVACLPQ